MISLTAEGSRKSHKEAFAVVQDRRLKDSTQVVAA